VQLDALRKAGCERVFAEKLSGTTAARPQLRECLDFVREGDILVITRLDRLARSLTDLCNIGVRLQAKSVELRALEQPIDTSTSTGRLTFNILGVIAQFETELRADRQREGIAKARARGTHLGRHHKLEPELVEQMCRDRRQGMAMAQLCRVYGLTRASVYRYLRNHECLPDGMPAPSAGEHDLDSVAD
jgi:DNA invertase Pin-like site-specific DNA recombinase